jgi:hypothetical protein
MEKVILNGPTVVGKIELKQEDQTRGKKNVWEIYLHFAERLKERYGLDISKKEYLSLCNEPFKVLGERPNSTNKVKIVFKDVEVFAIRSKKGKKLITALPKRK